MENFQLQPLILYTAILKSRKRGMYVSDFPKLSRVSPTYCADKPIPQGTRVLLSLYGGDECMQIVTVWAFLEKATVQMTSWEVSQLYISCGFCEQLPVGKINEKKIYRWVGSVGWFLEKSTVEKTVRLNLDRSRKYKNDANSFFPIAKTVIL